MPPKKANAPSKKNVEKKKVKNADDKTFGLKNKKGAKQQKFIEQVNKQVFKQDPKAEREKNKKASAKEAREAYLAELDAILKPVTTERKVMVSKKQENKDKDKEVTYLTIEELVEVERIKLKNSGKKLTPVTLESFLIWKQKKKSEEKKREVEDAKIKAKYAKEGKIVSSTGKELFAYYHDQIDINDDEDAADIEYDSDYEQEQSDLKAQGGYREITAETFYYEGVDAAINEELFADDIDLDALAAELEDLEGLWKK